jgi:hypothetical protein
LGRRPNARLLPKNCVADRRRKATHDQTGSDGYDDCAHRTVISVGSIIVRRGFGSRRDITARERGQAQPLNFASTAEDLHL